MTRLSEPTVVSRWRIIVVMAALLAALAGCSAVRFGYNQAPELVYWWLDGYADFDAVQSPRVRNALGQWFAWHRHTQLPDYAGLLARAEAEVLADTSPERACRWWSDLRQRADVATEQALPLAAALIPTLSAEQLRNIEHRQAKANEDFRAEYLTGDAAQRLQELVKRSIERTEFLYGRLDERQRERIAQGVAASPFDPELWFAERQQRQQEALQLLRHMVEEPPAREAAIGMLRSYFDHVMRSPREPYRRYIERLERYNCAFAASLHNATTPAQRRSAALKMKGWEADLRALAADAK